MSKLRDQIQEVRNLLANKDAVDAEEIKKKTSELQQASLKLFEMAYKKVCIARVHFHNLHIIAMMPKNFSSTESGLLTLVEISTL